METNLVIDKTCLDVKQERVYIVLYKHQHMFINWIC